MFTPRNVWRNPPSNFKPIQMSDVIQYRIIGDPHYDSYIDLKYGYNEHETESMENTDNFHKTEIFQRFFIKSDI